MSRLSDLLDQYVSERDICPQYAAQLRHHVRQYIRQFGDDLCDVNVQNVNTWLSGVHGKPVTRKAYRQCLLSVMNYAADIGLVARLDARRIKRPRIVYECPRAYCVDDVRRLVAAAGVLEGCYRGGVRKALYWRAMISAAYDSGLRRGDLLGLPRKSVGRIVIVNQKKTGGLVVTGFHRETVRMVLSLPGDTPLAWPLAIREFSRQFKVLTEESGVGGLFRWLRRTSGTLAGAEHLGHRTAAVFYRHYWDPRLVENVTMPPRL